MQGAFGSMWFEFQLHIRTRVLAFYFCFRYTGNEQIKSRKMLEHQAAKYQIRIAGGFDNLIISRLPACVDAASGFLLG